MTTEPTEPTDQGEAITGPDDEKGGSGLAAALIGFVVVALVAIGVGVGAIVVLGDDGDEAAGPTEYVVDVPEGTFERMRRGEQVEIIPAQVDLALGSTMIIRNADTRAHEVGPFSVQPGETLRYTFQRAGTYQGNCTVHPSGEVKIIVT